MIEKILPVVVSLVIIEAFFGPIANIIRAWRRK